MTCPNGGHVLGGGFSSVQFQTDPPHGYAAVNTDGPTQDGTGWIVVLEEVSTPTGSSPPIQSFTVWAICA